MGKLLGLCYLLPFLFGVWIFSSGFLLSRQEVPVINKASSSVSTNYKRVVFIIIDALRFDFAKNLPFVKSLQNSSRFFLAEFWSDAPTTTAQRLKGLTTGSLPTFIDVSKNFVSENIGEDNWLDQLVRSGSNVTFMGDDTWEQLFKGRFFRSFPYPSFNVKDLDTVDNGVKEHIFEELNRTDWKVIIGHFLGVDHAGHTYGPNTNHMERKLKEMNDFLEKLVKEISNDTLLIVAGDHGMTFDGNHGGETDDELSATLMLYSPFLNISRSNQYRRIAQIDLVPSISLLLGIPIPFGSLGLLIPEFFGRNQTIYERLLEANFIQVKEFVSFYQSEFKMFSDNDLELLEDLNKKWIRSNDKIDAMQKYVLTCSTICRRLWSKFDLFAMSLGFLICLLSVVLFWGRVWIRLSNALFGISFVSVLILLAFQLLFGRGNFFVGGIVLGLLVSHLNYLKLELKDLDILALVFGFMHCFSLFSVNCLENEVLWNIWVFMGLLCLKSLKNSKWGWILLCVAISPYLKLLSIEFQLLMAFVVCMMFVGNFRAVYCMVFVYFLSCYYDWSKWNYFTQILVPRMVFLFGLVWGAFKVLKRRC